METLLTPDEVSALLKIPKSWLYGRIHSRTLPFPMVKIGHYVRFPESGVKDFIAKSTSLPAIDSGKVLRMGNHD